MKCTITRDWHIQWNVTVWAPRISSTFSFYSEEAVRDVLHEPVYPSARKCSRNNSTPGHNMDDLYQNRTHLNSPSSRYSSKESFSWARPFILNVKLDIYMIFTAAFEQFHHFVVTFVYNLWTLIGISVFNGETNSSFEHIGLSVESFVLCNTKVCSYPERFHQSHPKHINAHNVQS